MQLGRRGRRFGEQAMLKGWQCDAIVKLITDRTAEQLPMPFVLWTAAAVRDLISLRYGMTLAVCTVGKHLQKWGFTPLKPIRKAWQQNSAAVEKWPKEEYPEIAKRAKAKRLWI